MGMGGGSKKAKTGADGRPVPTVTTVTPTAGQPIPRESVQDAQAAKSASLLSQNDEDENLKKGVY